ncbi:RNA-binding domain-containing protein [Desulfonatronum thioautotrophicum]|uniref:RNA-binding domain-containing protein n=1 Tax=Desulfonatronum thioautotrophicum TaxID=617001 RepID=UPI0005EB8A44|nr:RNA-binding domain-containing protein [Desulfonatronum thioautotrophicum]
MRPDELKIIIASGEDSRTEFKSASFHNDSLAKEVAAFANMRGGQVLIGVEDDGRVSGVDQAARQIERVVSICRNNIVPPVIPDVETVDLSQGRVLVVTVERGEAKPYKVRSSNKYYIRAGTSAVEPTQEELVRLLQDGGRFHFEVSATPGSGIDDLDLLKVRQYCREHRKIDFEDEELPQICYNLQIVDEEGRLTVAGNLFFGRRIGRFLPQAGLELNAFAGTDAVSLLTDSDTVLDAAPDCIQAGETFVRRNSHIRPMFNAEETRRRDVPDYEPFVVRELLANAFAHRDWSIFGQRIRLNLFSDRLEIFSPGSLPNTLNLTRALAGISYYRNPLIAQMLKDYGLVDKLGRGLQKVVRHYATSSLPPPEFDPSNDAFRVVVRHGRQES